jgi:tRNA A37 threonylcarbamoyladenosine dehydratase
VNGESFYSRTAALIGGEGIARLQRASVAVFGLGGVGGHTAEALVRAGVGAVTLVDGDVFKESNLNRQIFALKSTLGKNKAEAASARLFDINGAARITACPIFFNKETAGTFDFKAFDYVVDAIDSVADKVLLIETAQKNGTRIISSMGAGNKLRADFKVGDIFETKGCPLARVMRGKLKKVGITRLKTVYSDEASQTAEAAEKGAGKTPPASISYVPGICGLVLAGEVIRELIQSKNKDEV